MQQQPHKFLRLIKRLQLQLYVALLKPFFPALSCPLPALALATICMFSPLPFVTAN